MRRKTMIPIIGIALIGAIALSMTACKEPGRGGINIVKTDPEVTWPTGLTATVGQTLADVSLAGKGTGDGVFSWTAALTTSVGAEGPQTHNMTFTPTDTVTYNTLTNDVTINVTDSNKGTPTITTLPTAETITYGAMLKTSELTGGSAAYESAPVAGTFEWANGEIIPTVSNLGYDVIFKPTDTTAYNTVTAKINITVNKADPEVTWPTGLMALVGQTLADVSLAGKGTGDGTFSWTEPLTTSVGTEEFVYIHNMTFTPTDTANYNTITRDVVIYVVIVTIPNQVGSFLATPGNEKVVLVWTEPSWDGGSEITGYEVTMDDWASKATKAANELTHTYTGLTNGTEYTFKIRALNAEGASAESTVSATPQFVITSAAELEAYLEAATGGDTANNPVHVPLGVSSLGGFSDTTGTIGNIIKKSGKFVSLDLSMCTFTGIDSNAFYYCNALTSITIPNSVISIGSRAFYEHRSLTSITIPASVTSIGDLAFSSVTIQGAALTAINVDTANTTYSSEDGVLYNKNKTILIKYPPKKTDTSFTIPASVTSIGNSAFERCFNLVSITIPYGVISIGDDALLQCINLESITIPASVTSIGEGAFQNCSKLTIITIPASVTSIGRNVFQYCYSLESVTIPASVTSIGNRAFSSCTGLTGITIPDSVESIGSYAFSGCSSLESVTIPASVESIGDYAFNGCSSLASVTFERDDDTTISNTNAFPGNLVTESGGTGAQNRFGTWTTNNPGTNPTWTKFVITSAADLTAYLASATGGTTASNPILVTLNVSDLGGHYETEGSIGYIIYQYRVGSSNPKYISLDLSGGTLTDIEDSAFNGCTNIVSVTIGNSVTSIGQQAFDGCSLTSIIIPANVTTIVVYAFRNCTSLASVTFEGTIAASGFNSNAFYELGDIRNKFYATDATNGTPGTYTRESGGTVWTKQ